MHVLIAIESKELEYEQLNLDSDYPSTTGDKSRRSQH